MLFLLHRGQQILLKLGLDFLAARGAIFKLVFIQALINSRAGHLPSLVAAPIQQPRQRIRSPPRGHSVRIWIQVNGLIVVVRPEALAPRVVVRLLGIIALLLRELVADIQLNLSAACKLAFGRRHVRAVDERRGVSPLIVIGPVSIKHFQIKIMINIGNR